MYQNTPPLDPALGEKFTNWKNEPSIQTLKFDLESAKPAHDAHVSKVTRWNDLLNVTGKAKPPAVKGRSSIQPKLIRRQAEWRYSALTEPFVGSDKMYQVKPKTFEDEAAARQNEMLLNWQFQTKLNKIKFFDDYIRSTVDDGTCVVRVGWRRAVKTEKQEVPVWDHFEIENEDDVQILQQFIDLRDANPRQFEETASAEIKAAIEYYDESGEVTVAVQNGTEEVDVEILIENKPTLEVLNLANVWIDPSCNGDMNKALFAVVSFETNQADLKKEGKRYKNLDKVNWEGNTVITQPDYETATPSDFNFRDRMRKRVVAFEYWGFYDIHKNGELVPFVATWIGDVLIRMELNPFPDGKLPFVVVPYLPVKRELMGETDAELLEDNQKILGATMRGMIDLMGRSANGQQGFAKGMLDPLNRRRFDNGQDYEFNPNVSPQAGHIEHKYPEIPQSALMMLNLQNQEAESLAGVKAFSGGMSGDSYGKTSAQAVRGVLDAASKREMAILRRLANGMVEIGRKMAAMNSEFLSPVETIRVTNKQYVKIKREDLKGDFDLEMDISTAEVDNAQAQDISFMVQTIGPNMDQSITTMLLAEIARLKRMPVLAEKLTTWEPKPDPVAEKLQELEIAKLEAEIAKLHADAEESRAKAVKAKAEADQTNLDFVEQETGTKHEREMEKQGGQARANQDLTITKAIVASKKPDEKEPDIEAGIGFNEMSDVLRGGNRVGSPPAQDEFVPNVVPTIQPPLQ